MVGILWGNLSSIYNSDTKYWSHFWLLTSFSKSATSYQAAFEQDGMLYLSWVPSWHWDTHTAHPLIRLRMENQPAYCKPQSYNPSCW